MVEHCAICGCELHRTRHTYATPTVEGRGHATKHHYVAKRFFGRSANRQGTQREGIFDDCPWGVEGKADVFCYECHEELLHNPVLLPEDVAQFAELVRAMGLAEDRKSTDRSPLAGRIKLLQKAISIGIGQLLAEAKKQ